MGVVTQVVPCACGCGESVENRDARGRPRRFIHGHNSNLQVSQPIEDRFMARVMIDVQTGCWMWIGNSTRGYGVFWNGERRPRRDGGRKQMPVNVLAHRWAYAHFVGEIPDGMNVCHRCDVPLCVNPEHLFVGTQAENVADCTAKGRRAKSYPNRKRAS